MHFIGAYSKSMNHGLEAKVNFSSPDDLGDILYMVSHPLCCATENRSYTRVVRLQQSNFDAFLLEILLGLGKVERGMVRRCVPNQNQYVP